MSHVGSYNSKLTNVNEAILRAAFRAVAAKYADGLLEWVGDPYGQRKFGWSAAIQQIENYYMALASAAVLQATGYEVTTEEIETGEIKRQGVLA